MQSGGLALFLWSWVLQVSLAGPSSGAIESGDAALRAGKFDTALRHYSLGCDLEPSSYLPFLKRSSVYTVIGQKRSALRDLNSVIEINPTYLNARLKRIKLRLECCLLDGAEQDLQHAMQHGASQLPLTLAELHSLKSTYRHAQSLANRAQDPLGAARDALGLLDQLKSGGHCTDSEEAVELAVRMMLRAGEHEQAVVEGGKLIKLNRNSITALGLRAEAFYQMGDVETSIKHLREGLKQDPEHKTCKALHKKVRNLQRRMVNAEKAFEAGEFEEAAAGYAGALKVDPAHRLFAHDLNLKLCKAQVGHKDGEAAVQACDAALAIDRTSVEALLARGEGKALLEDFEGSLNDYKQAKEHRADDRSIDEKIQQGQRLLEQSKRKNYYKILGLKRSASKSEIKRVYRKLALKFHPDKVSEEEKPEAEKKFRDVAEAYGVLNDPELRQKYDNGEDVSGQAQQQQQQGGFPGGFGFPGGGNFHFHFR